MKRFMALALLTAAIVFQAACTKTETAPEASAPATTEPSAAAAPGSAAPTTPETAPAAPTDGTTTTTPPATH